MKKLLIVTLSLAMLFSLASCGKKEVSVVVAKEREGIENGTAMSGEDVSALMAQIEAAEKEKEWIEDTVSESIASCYFTVTSGNKTTLYKYSDSGVMDDMTEFRALVLPEACRDAMNEILSKYVNLSFEMAEIPDEPVDQKLIN